MKRVKFLIALNAFVLFLALGLVFIVLFAVSCVKDKATTQPGNSQIERVEDLISQVNAEPLEIEEAPECEEIYDTEGSVKVSVFGWKADTSSSACVGDKAVYKYLNHVVAKNGNELSVDFTGGLPTDSIVGVTCPYMTLQERIDERERTHRTLIIQNVELPKYKPRTMGFKITLSNGKVLNKSVKMIPALNNANGHQFGQSAYFINFWAVNNKKLTDINTAIPETRYTITPSWSPSQGTILCYGTGAQSHYAVISNAPIQKNTKVNGVYRDVWKFKIKEQNAFCNQKQTTKTVVWYSGIGVPNSNPKRDSAFEFRQFSFP